MSKMRDVSHFSQSADRGPQHTVRRSPFRATLSGALAILFMCCCVWATSSSPAAAGVWYDCPVGMHRFLGCVQPDKPPPTNCPLIAGDPVDVLTGRLSEEVTDWSSGGLFPLELKRSYTSTALTLDASPYSSLGRGWRSNFDARVRLNASSATGADWAHFILPDTMEYNFNKQNGAWQFMAMDWKGSYWPNLTLTATKRTDMDVTLAAEGEQFVLRTPNGVKYVFDTATHAPDPQWHVDGYRTQLLSEIRFPGGYVQKITYSGDYPFRIFDNLGRWIEMQFSKASARSTLLSQVLTSDGTILKYSYQDRLPGLTSNSAIDFMALSAVSYPDLTPAIDTDNPKVGYQYLDEPGRPGLLLTGMTDERGVRFASWSYDSKGRVLSSEHAGGQDRTQFAYDDANSVVTVTNPLGRSTRYSYRMNPGFVRQLVAVGGIATPGCAASNTRYDYDSNGFRSKATDSEGRVTTWVRDGRGRPLTTTEAAGTPQARVTTMTWQAGGSLPLTVNWPGQVRTFTYNASGQVTGDTATDPAGPREARTTSYAFTSYRPPAVTPPGPTGAPLSDVVIPVANRGADQGVSGWFNLIGGLSVAANPGSACPPSNPCFFAAPNGLTIAVQDVAVPPARYAEVDSGSRAAKVTWLQNGSDLGSVNLLYLDSAGSAIGSLVTSTLQNVSSQSWTDRSQSGAIPSGTRAIRIVILAIRSGTDVLIDDIALKLVPDGKSAPNPFLMVVNPSGLQGSVTGWTTGGAQGPAIVATAQQPCTFCTYFTNADTATGASSAAQVLTIPADRIAEIDSARRGLDISWLAWANQREGEISASAEFLDAAGTRVLGRRFFVSTVSTAALTRQLFNVPVIPSGTRRVRLTFSTSFLPIAVGSRVAGWSDVNVQLVPPASPPTAVVDLLTSVDGSLPGGADTVRYAYDASGNLTSVTNELGQVTRIIKLDAGGRPLSVTDPNGIATAMAYDPRGRLTSVTVNPGAAQARTIIAYDAAGQVTRVTSPDGSFLAYTWNDARRLTSVTNNASERIDNTYNANGDQTSRTVKSASGAILRQQSALFDELGRLMRSIGAAGQQTLFKYDRTDNLTEVKDPRGGLFAYAYDGLQNLASLTDQTGARTGLTRDAQSEVTAYRDPRGLTTAYVRNGFGEITQESGPDVGTTVIVRDKRGLATKITDPRGAITLLTYDAAGRLVEEAYPADPSQDVSYFYDDTANGNKGIGRLTGVIDASGAMSRYYDALGRVIAETRIIAGKSYSTTYAYNAAGRITAITYPSGRVVSYTRDALGRVTAVTTKATAADPPLTVASGIAWSPMSSRLTALTHGNGLTAARAYDGDGRLTSVKLANGATRLVDLSYAYADGMNLTAVNDNLAAANSVALAYDAAQRLASARGPWGGLTYAYTPNGDRSQEVLTPPGGTALTTVLSYPATSNRLASTSAGSITTRAFSYDAAGNLVTQVMGPLRLAFAYNQRNRPVTVTRTGDGTQTSTYLYNALEQMVQRSSNAPGGPAGTVHYIYGLDGSLLAEADGSTGKTLRDYIWLPMGDASPAADNDNEEGASPPPLPVGLVTGVNTTTPQFLMVHADHLGRPLRLTDATRATVWAAAYDPFGQPWQITGTVEQNLRVPGQYFLIETGLSYNWHRIYDPATGRYTQPDPLRFVDGLSVYGYAGASPMMRVDPEGEQVRIPIPGAPPIGPGPYRGNKSGPDWKPGLKPRWPAQPPGMIDYIWNGCEWILRRFSSGSGGGGGDDDDDKRCQRVESECRERCVMVLDNAALPDRQSMNYHRCVNQCRHDQRCGGQDYSDGWDNGRLGTPRPWQ